MCEFALPLYVGCSDVSIHIFVSSPRITILNSSDLHLKPQAVRRSKHLLPGYKTQSVNIG